MRKIGAAVILLGLPLLNGCVPAQSGTALATASSFQQRLGRQDWAAVCGLLSSDARSQLEATAATSCAEALPRLRLPTNPAEHIQLWGHNATASVGTRALFLSQFSDGWRVIAAGCSSRGVDRPWACTVRG